MKLPKFLCPVSRDRAWWLACTIALAVAIGGAAEADEAPKARYDRALDAMMADLDNPQKSYEFALSAIAVGDLNGAITALERVLRLDPTRSNIKAELAYLYLKVGNSSEAERLFAEVDAEGAIPPQFYDRFSDLRGEAIRASRRTGFDASALVAGQYETNANGGPRDLPGLVTGAREEDYSVLVNVGLGYSYDLGFQAGHSIDARFNFYGVRYSKDASPNVMYGGLEVGPTIVLASDATFRPYLTGSVLGLNDAHYRDEVGGGFDYLNGFAPWLRFDARGEITYQDFHNSDPNPTAERQDGMRYFGRLGTVTPLSSDLFLRLEVNGISKDASVGRQSYQEFGAGGQLVWRPEFDLFGFDGQNWTVGVGGGYLMRRYEEPDLIISASQAREDDRYTLRAFAGIPISREVDLVATVNWTDNSSNYPTETYDNLAVTLGVEIDFDEFFQR